MGTKIPDLHDSDMQQVEEPHFAKTFGDFVSTTYCELSDNFF